MNPKKVKNNYAPTITKYQKTLKAAGIEIPRATKSMKEILYSSLISGLRILEDGLSKRGISISETNFEEENLTSKEIKNKISLLLSSVTTRRPSIGESLKYLEEKYWNGLNSAQNMLKDVGRHFDPDDDQIEELVKAHLAPFFQEMDKKIFLGSISLPIEKVIATIEPRGSDINHVIKTMYEQSLKVINETLRSINIDLGQDPPKNLIFSTITSVRPGPGISLKKLEQEYNEIMKNIEIKLRELRKYIAPEEDQIYRFVKVELKKYLQKITSSLHSSLHATQNSSK